MQRAFTHKPYNKWYTYKFNGYTWVPDYTNGKSQRSNSLRAISDDQVSPPRTNMTQKEITEYLNSKYGLQKIYWYTSYHPANYEEMYWSKWGVRNKY